MLDKILAAAIAIAIPTQANPIPDTVFTMQGTVNEIIPEEFKGNTKVEVQFEDPMAVEWFCLDGNYIEEWIIYACYKRKQDKLIMPNPCKYPEARLIGSYAHLMCHEMAHKNGWRHKD